jgi:hypothetical protein
MKGVFASAYLTSWFCEGLYKSWLYNSTWIWFWIKKWEHLRAKVYERVKELQSKLQTFLSGVITSSRTTNVCICNCHSQDVHFYYFSLLKYLPKHHVFCCWFAWCIFSTLDVSILYEFGLLDQRFCSLI